MKKHVREKVIIYLLTLVMVVISISPTYWVKGEETTMSGVPFSVDIKDYEDESVNPEVTESLQVMGSYDIDMMQWGTFYKLRDVGKNLDVIHVSYAKPATNWNITYPVRDGRMKLDLSGFPQNYTEEDFKADIKALQAAGKKVVLSIGGFDGTAGYFQVETEAAANQFVRDIKDIVDTYGFDGIDFCLHMHAIRFNPWGGDGDINAPISPTIVYMTQAIRDICESYGEDFILSWEPTTYESLKGYQNYAGLLPNGDDDAGVYLPMIQALSDITSYVHVHMNDWEKVETPWGMAYDTSTKEGCIAMDRMLLEGFYVGGYERASSFFRPLRPDQVVVSINYVYMDEESKRQVNQTLREAADMLEMTYPGIRGIYAVVREMEIEASMEETSQEPVTMLEDTTEETSREPEMTTEDYTEENTVDIPAETRVEESAKTTEPIITTEPEITPENGNADFLARKLPEPVGFSYMPNDMNLFTFVWQSVPDAEQYFLYVNDTNIGYIQSTSVKLSPIYFPTYGAYTIGVQAVAGDRISDIHSIQFTYVEDITTVHQTEGNDVLAGGYTYANNGIRNMLLPDENTIHDENYVDLIKVMNAQVSASSQLQQAVDAIDEDIDTRWESELGKDKEYLTVDFRVPSMIQEVDIVWEAASAEKYLIQVSEDGEHYTNVACLEGGESRQNRLDVITFDHAVRGRYVRIFGIMRTSPFGYSIYDMAIYGENASTVNRRKELLPDCKTIAQNMYIDFLYAYDAQVKASSERGKNYPDNVMDEDIWSCWEAYGTEDEFLFVDLGSVQKIKEVDIIWRETCAEKYKIQISLDGKNFTDFQDVENWALIENRWDICTVEELVSARYIKIQCIASTASSGYAIYDLAVYGALGEEPTVAPILSEEDTVSQVDITEPIMYQYTNDTRRRELLPNQKEVNLVNYIDWIENARVVVTASSKMGDNAPGNTMDDDISSFWESEWDDDTFIMFDLRHVKYIKEMDIIWRVTGAKEYIVQISTDGTHFVNAATIENGLAMDNRWDTITFENVIPARYVKVQGVKRAVAEGYAIYDLAIYGEPDAVPESTTMEATSVEESLSETEEDTVAETSGVTESQWIWLSQTTIAESDWAGETEAKPTEGQTTVLQETDLGTDVMQTPGIGDDDTKGQVQETESISVEVPVTGFTMAETTKQINTTAGGQNTTMAQTTPPTKPTLKKTKIKSIKEKNYHTVWLTWKKVKGVSVYVVYRAKKKNGTYQQIKKLRKAKYLDKNVKAGNRYYYKIRVVDKAQNSTLSKGKLIRVKGGPDRPKIQITSNANAWSIIWGILTDNSTGIEIYMKNGKDSYQQFTLIHKTTNIKKSKTKKGATGIQSALNSLEPGVTYAFRARTYAKVKGKTVYSKWSKTIKYSR